MIKKLIQNFLVMVTICVMAVGMYQLVVDLAGAKMGAENPIIIEQAPLVQNASLH